MHNKLMNMAVLLAGAVLPFAFAPAGIYPLAILAPLVLLVAWQDVTLQKAFWRGALFGLGLFGVGVSWIYISIHRYGNTSAPLAVVFTCLFIIVLALFPAILGWLLRFYFPTNSKIKYWMAFPALWVILEIIRGSLFTGFPWLLLGFSQTNSPLHSYAPLIGCFGISYLIALNSGLLFTAFTQPKHNKLLSILLIAVIWIMAFTIEHIQWTHPKGKPITVSLIQGNIAQEVKWSQEAIQPTLNLYRKLTKRNWQSQLIIWPEAAIPLSELYAENYLTQLDAETKMHHSALITGIPTEAEQAGYYYNALLVLGNGNGRYYKRYLVPFGEYVPFETLLRGIIGFFNIPMSNFVEGPAQQPQLTAAGLTIAPFICYEIAYANAVRSVALNADVLVTISNDAWFGDSLAPAQHLQIAQLRALETGRYLLFSTNTGTTAIINPEGQIAASIPQFQQAVLTGIITAMTGTTPWYYLSTCKLLTLLAGLMIFALIFTNSRSPYAA